MRIATNVSSMMALNQFDRTATEKEQEAGKLSSGNRILSAAADPSGLAISENMKAKIRSLSQTERNMNDGISLLQVAEGSLQVLQNLTSRLKELAIQSANDTMTDNDRSTINREYQGLKKEIVRITESAKYNGNSLLNDNGSVYDIQVGTGGGSNDRLVYDMSKVLGGLKSLPVITSSIDSKYASQTALGSIDELTEKVSSSRASLGSVSNRIVSALQNSQVSRENTSGANSRIRDNDVASSTANDAKLAIQGNATLSLLTQANTRPQAMLKLLS